MALTRTAAVLILAMPAIASCGGGTGLDLQGSGAPVPQEARPSQPPVPMAGRWMLASPGHGQCNMTFGAASPSAAEGTIAPEGGCPGRFYTSRRWAFDSTGLTIRNHNSEPLAQLSSAGGGRFDGKATNGAAVTLTR